MSISFAGMRPSCQQPKHDERDGCNLLTETLVLDERPVARLSGDIALCTAHLLHNAPNSSSRNKSNYRI
jgi:hypothetical protein